ncbi:MAG: sugar-binding transcriptional regulator, partial [Eubacterium sp.]|nr:sugar-binding transcriptional regulator [Eubacterium sp.]
MKKVVNDLRLMIKACDMYFNENLSQQEIASKLNISRPTLSRLLISAKEQKLIKIQVSDVDFVKYWELSEELKKKHGLKDVIIADSGDTDHETKAHIGKIAAAYLGHLIKDQDVVGISMGSTLHQVVQEMKECRDRKITVIPLVGGVGQANLRIHANTLAEQMAQLYHSEFHPIFVPARVFSQVVKNELMKDLTVTSMMKYASGLNIAILGIGFPNEYSSIQTTGYFAENEM